MREVKRLEIRETKEVSCECGETITIPNLDDDSVYLCVGCYIGYLSNEVKHIASLSEKEKLEKAVVSS